MIMRGGSSKGAYFLRDDLPDDEHERDSLIRRVMGSPDPRQIDGIGGAHPLTSKVAIVSPAAGDDADLDYLFLQVGVDDGVVTDRQNCGNLLAGVGPFALERGLIAAPADGHRSVRIRMLNTDSIATAHFVTRDDAPVYEGDTAISGVPGSAAAIRLEFEGLAGGSAGALLPTGRASDTIEGVPCTLIDNGMPVVVMRAADLGVSGYETGAELEANELLRQRLESIRSAAGPLMNLGDVRTTTVPKLTLVAPPVAGGHLATRTFIPHRCHDAIGVLGAISVTTAALIEGTRAHECLVPSHGDTVVLEHPTGHFETIVELSGADSMIVERAGVVRTARKLIDGYVFPRTNDH